VVAVVALRLAVGWHFYREGADKLLKTKGEFASAGFMKAAKGPLTPLFHWMVWDIDGRARLDKAATLDYWRQYQQRVVRHYRFDAQQQEQAQAAYDAAEERLEVFFDERKEDLANYLKGLERRDRNRRDEARQEVESLWGQSMRIERELSKDLSSLLAPLKKIWDLYEADLNGVASDEQARRGPLAAGKIARPLFGTDLIDRIIPTFDLLVGLCLLAGLFTRIAALGAAGFLASIIATQWPWALGLDPPVPVYYLIIECFAMLFLAAIGGGRFFGLDVVWGYVPWRKWAPTRYILDKYNTLAERLQSWGRPSLAEKKA
jgi:uncharacterized membrane protein YphA (DoxX/SURF4 family)